MGDEPALVTTLFDSSSSGLEECCEVWLGDSYSLSHRVLDTPLVLPDPGAICLLEWDVAPETRTIALDQLTTADPPPPEVVALVDGVPQTDPIAAGADLYVSPTSASVRTAVRTSHLQHQYDATLCEVTALLGGEMEAVDPVSLETAITHADVALSKLAEELTYVDIFRQLIEE